MAKSLFLCANVKCVTLDDFSILSFIVFQVPFCENEGGEASITDAVTKTVQLDCSEVGIAAKTLTKFILKNF